MAVGHSGCPLRLEMLEKLENEPFSEFGWKSWETIIFSPTLAGKARILFLGVSISNGIIRWKISSRNRVEEGKIRQYHVRQAFNTKSTKDWKFCCALPGWLVDPYLPHVVYQKILNLYRKFQFIGNFKVNCYLVKIVGHHFQWLEFHIKIHDMAAKPYIFLPKWLEKCNFFLKLWLEFQLYLSGHPASK